MRLHGREPGTIVAYSKFYFNKPDGGISAMYGTSSQLAATGSTNGSYNLFLGTFNWLKLINANDQVRAVSLVLTTANGSLWEKSYMLQPHAVLELPLHEGAIFGTSAERYGPLRVQGNGIAATLLRFRQSSAGGLDFAFPTEVN